MMPAARVVAADGHADPVLRVGAHAGPAAGAVPRGGRVRPPVDPGIAGRRDPVLDSARHEEGLGHPEGRRGARAPVLPGHGLEALEGEGPRHELGPVRDREPVVVERGAGHRRERVPAAAAHPPLDAVGAPSRRAWCGRARASGGDRVGTGWRGPPRRSPRGRGAGTRRRRGGRRARSPRAAAGRRRRRGPTASRTPRACAASRPWVVALAAAVGGGAEGYHIARAPPPTATLLRKAMSARLWGTFSRRLGWSQTATFCKRGFISYFAKYIIP